MSDEPLLLAIDQGTTSSRAMVFDAAAQVRATAQKEFPQHYPQPGWVEHEAEDLWTTTLETARNALEKAENGDARVAAIGLTNQRETVVIWDRATGEPIDRAVVWQDRRTAEICAGLTASGHEETITAKTGLLIDPYFSATKIAWILDRVDGARQRAEKGELAFGTVDSFLIWRLTDGGLHVTDETNASRTSLYNIHTLDWDDELLALFDVPRAILPEVRPSAGDFGETDPDLFGRAIPIRGVAGDQQAAAFGQCCFREGDVKSTYGTGCFLLMHTGTTPRRSTNRLLTTLACRTAGAPEYAVEGSIFVAGAVSQWLRDTLGVIGSSGETETLAASTTTNDGIYFVPAFTGLGAPHWMPGARGALYGLTRDAGRAEIARAALESVAYQTHDLLDCLVADGASPASLRIDGGMSVNNWFAQFLADITALPVDRPAVTETTALGAAFLAGLQSGVFDSTSAIETTWALERNFTPQLAADARQSLLEGWEDAVATTLFKAERDIARGRF